MERFLEAALLLVTVLALGAVPGIIGAAQTGPVHSQWLPGPMLRVVFPLCSLSVLGGWPILGPLTFFLRRRLAGRQARIARFAAVVVSAVWLALAFLYARVLLHPWGGFP